MLNRVGVVVLDLDQSEVTRRCLTSLNEGSRYPDYLVLVENGTQTNARGVQLYPNMGNLIVLQPGRNLGVPGGRNLGLNYLESNSDADVLVILDNDTVVPEAFIERIANFPISGLDVFAPVIFDMSTQRVWSSGGHLGLDGSIEQCYSVTETESESLSSVDWAPGACLIMSPEAWRRAGPFDAWMNFLFEDIEWCLRLRNAGGRILVDQKLHLIHE